MVIAAIRSTGPVPFYRARLVAVGVAFFSFYFGCDAAKPNGVGPADLKTAKPKVPLKLDFGTDTIVRAKTAFAANMVDVAAEKGLDFSYYNDAGAGNLYLPEALGGGAAAFDFDLDGYCDVYLANGRTLPAHQPQSEHRDHLFRNIGGCFANVTDHSGLREFDYTHGVAVGDVNGDGFDDVLVANFGQASLFVNQGDGSLVELQIDALESNPSFWVAPLFVDLNSDGLEDLLLVSYVEWSYDSELEMFEHGLGYPSPGQFRGGPYLALENQGDLTFQDRTSTWGFTEPAKCLGISAADLDHDLQPEIYVANDGIANACYSMSLGSEIDSRVTNASRGPKGQEFVTTNGQRRWLNLAERAGVAGSEDGQNEASMCVTFADFSRNGWADIFVTNYLLKKNTLYANKGHLSFRDISRGVRLDVVGSPFVSFGAVPIDLNLDGWWDVFVANGHVIGPKAPINEMTCQVLHNFEGVFFDASAASGSFLEMQALGRCVVTLDVMNSGLPAVLVTFTDRPVALVENQIDLAGSWLCLEVFDPRHRPLTGGRIELQFPDRSLVIPWTAGGSYIGECQKRWTLGLGPKGEMPIIKVFWPHGQVDTWESLPAGTLCRLAPGLLQRDTP